MVRPPGVATLPASRSCTYFKRAGFVTSLAGLGRCAARSACHCTVWARYSRPPPRVAALRRSSRETVEGARPSCRAIARTPSPRARASATCSRSAKDRYRPVGSGADGARFDGGIPPHCRKHLLPTAGDTPAMLAASSLECPSEIDFQNGPRSARCKTGGLPGDRSSARSDRPDFNFFGLKNTSDQEVLRRRIEFTKYAIAFFKMSRSIFTRASSARSLDSSICWALTGRSPAPCSAPLSASRTQLLSVCSGHPQHTRRHRRFLPRRDQPDGLQLELHRVPRAAIRSFFLAHLSCSVNAFSTSAMEYVFRGQGQSSSWHRCGWPEGAHSGHEAANAGLCHERLARRAGGLDRREVPQRD